MPGGRPHPEGSPPACGRPACGQASCDCACVQRAGMRCVRSARWLSGLPGPRLLCCPAPALLGPHAGAPGPCLALPAHCFSPSKSLGWCLLAVAPPCCCPCCPCCACCPGGPHAEPQLLHPGQQRAAARGCAPPRPLHLLPRHRLHGGGVVYTAQHARLSIKVCVVHAHFH